MKNFKNTLIALVIVAIAGSCSLVSATNFWPDLVAMKNKNQSVSKAQIDGIANKAILILEQSGQKLFDVDGLNAQFFVDLPREKMTQNEKDMLADAIMDNDMFSAHLQAFTKNKNKSDAGRYAMDIMSQLPMMINSKPGVITHLKDSFKNKYQM